MRQNNFEISLLVKGKPVTEYGHQGQRFIEGRPGSEFEIELRNHMASRVLAVLSVDGLSVINAKLAGPDSTGYLLNGYETLRIPGWKVNDNTAAKFFFAGREGDSYVVQAGGDPRNRGVIGVLVYREKNRQVWVTQHGNVQTPMPQPFIGGGTVPYDPLRTVQDYYMSPSTTAGSHVNSLYAGPHSVSVNHVAGASATADAPRGIAPSEIQQARIPTPSPQNLGTGFGAATSFATTTVNFERGDLITMMVVYYDDRKGLRQRGIRIERPSRQRYAAQPQPFPAMSCQPPPGWKG